MSGQQKHKRARHDWTVVENILLLDCREQNVKLNAVELDRP